MIRPALAAAADVVDMADDPAGALWRGATFVVATMADGWKAEDVSLGRPVSADDPEQIAAACLRFLRGCRAADVPPFAADMIRDELASDFPAVALEHGKVLP